MDHPKNPKIVQVATISSPDIYSKQGNVFNSSLSGGGFFFFGSSI